MSTTLTTTKVIYGTQKGDNTSEKFHKAISRIPKEWADTIESIFFHEDQIQKRVKEMAIQISNDYAGEKIICVGVLNGGSAFAMDIIKHFLVPYQLDFIKVSSYGNDKVSSGTVKLGLDITMDPTDRHILILEDLIDTGTTLKWIKEHFRIKKAKSVKIAVFLDKKTPRQKENIKADYVGFECADEFLIGFGMDFEECYRGLPFIGIMKTEMEEGLTWQLFEKQDSITSAAVIIFFKNDREFMTVSKHSTDCILKRDQEDAQKLTQGIELAIEKGVLSDEVKDHPVTKISVSGKTVDEITKEIISKIGDDVQSGGIITLQGLSGTGKGTTVSVLNSLLPKAVTWSNGNVFRSLTLLATTLAKQKSCTLEQILTTEHLASMVAMLSFGKFNNKFDIQINGLGIHDLVSEIRNTKLKQPDIVKNIPTVARVTQGEVINIVKEALGKMVDDGITVIVEGREQTLQYIETPHRFELVLKDQQIIGQRRAAQRIMAASLKNLGGSGEKTPQQIQNALKIALSIENDAINGCF